MARKPFGTRLVRPEGVGTWTFAPIPRAVSSQEGYRAHERVQGTMDGTPFKSTLMPQGNGTYFLVVPKALREAIGKSAGDTVSVSIERDSSPVVIELPPELRRVLAGHAGAKSNYERLAPSHRKAFAQWVGGATQPETRIRRAAKAREMLAAGKTLN